MEDIKIGEYVRVSHMYRETRISKIEKVLEKDPCYKNMQMYRIDEIVQHGNSYYPSNKIYEEDILKHSSNLIDLIEVGDYVNGYRIDEITSWGVMVHKARGIDKSGFMIPVAQYSEDIKSIVTKEAFASVEYKVKEN